MYKGDKRVRYRRELTAIDYIHDYDIDVEKRDIFLFGREDYAHHEADDEPGVEYTMANRFIKNIRILQSLGDEPILVHLKTCGGYWEEGMAIYQAICACPIPVIMLNYTHARSMSSIILQAADKRAMLPYSTFMFHDGTFGTDGTVKQAFTEIEQLRLSREQMLDIYIERMQEAERWGDKSRSQCRRWLRDQMDRKEEVYLQPEQAIEHGFADMVFGADGKYDWTKLREYSG